MDEYSKIDEILLKKQNKVQEKSIGWEKELRKKIANGEMDIDGHPCFNYVVSFIRQLLNQKCEEIEREKKKGNPEFETNKDFNFNAGLAKSIEILRK